MTVIDEVVLPDEGDAFDVRLALRATGLLRVFNAACVLSAADVHVAQRLARLGHESDERVLLAAALAVRGVRLGSVCVDLSTARETVTAEDDARRDVDALPWPEPGDWLSACGGSALVAHAELSAPERTGHPLRLVGALLYLDRYWRQEQLVREELDARASRAVPPVDADALRDELVRLFPGRGPDRQRLAAAMAALRSVTVVAGGPGTGKTTTVARIIELLRTLSDPPPRIALAAPTGKAAARLIEAVHEEAQARGLDLADLSASTVHRLLGRKPGSRSRFRHDRHDRLPYDVVVVDETSMVSLTLMSRLVEAVRPEARLVLVGDPEQLASVEAGAVLGDLVERPAPTGATIPPQLGQVVPADVGDADPAALRNGVVRLTVTHRYGAAIGELAAAIRETDEDRVLTLLRAGGPSVSYVETPPDGTLAAGQLGALRDDVVDAARALTELADADQAREAIEALGRHRLLCAHRRGPYGVARWTEQVERWLADALGRPAAGKWYRGQPLLVTANDYDVELFNGDTGVVVDGGERGLLAAFGRGSKPALLSPSRLSAVLTVHAMTVHRAQGSQFDRATLLLPAADSRVLTRELFYTAVTRAQTHVRVIGSEAAVRRAVSRRVARASGLREAP
ncbi:MAG: exodeoxyribonuclease V subunit alpha [Nocardioidaceae bacterium]